MKDRKRKNGQVAHGIKTEKRRHRSRIVCSFEDETWHQIRSKAIAENTSFCHQVRILVECGFLYLEDEAEK